MKSKQVPTLNSRLLSFTVSNHWIKSDISCRCACTCHLISILQFSNLVNPMKKKYKSQQAGLCFLENTTVCWPETSAAPANVAFYAPRTMGGPRTDAQLDWNCGNSEMFGDVRQEETITSIKSLSQGSTLSKGLLATGHRLGPQTETFSWPCGLLPTHP